MLPDIMQGDNLHDVPALPVAMLDSSVLYPLLLCLFTLISLEVEETRLTVSPGPRVSNPWK